MIKIGLVFPFENFFPFAEATFHEHNSYEKLFNEITDEYTFEEYIIPDKELSNTQFDCDVIISRGITAQTIKNIVNDIPVVEIPVAGNDLVKILYNCKKAYGEWKKIAVIGSQSMIYGVEDLSDVIGLNLHCYVKKSFTDGPQLVAQAINDHSDIIVAGVGTCRYAESKGYSSVLIRSGKEAFWQALTEAKRVARINRREKEKTQKYITIMDYVHEGVIGIDNNGEISAFNEAAEEIVGISSSSVIGKKYSEISLPRELNGVIKKSSYFSNDIITIHDIHTAINKVPITFKGQILGTIVTIQDITKIQKIEGDIRKKIHNKGHVAKSHFREIVGSDPGFLQVIEKAKQFSLVDSNILIIGNTGTGKELFSQSIHNNSNRAKKPFVAVNCAAIPESLLESELFGYAPGAFTGALKAGKPGLFELAHQGTIFLDEIAEMPHSLQPRLLRVLQEREVMRIGDDKVIPIDVKVITATNKDLKTYVQENRFREDLYYRLNVLALQLPDLEERGNDLFLLAEKFLLEYSRRIKGFDMHFNEASFESLRRYSWKGNVRELKNICERLVVLNSKGSITPMDIDAVLPVSSPGNSCQEKEETGDMGAFLYQDLIKELQKYRFNKQKTAEALGVSRTTLWRWMKKWDIG